MTQTETTVLAPATTPTPTPAPNRAATVTERPASPLHLEPPRGPNLAPPPNPNLDLENVAPGLPLLAASLAPRPNGVATVPERPAASPRPAASSSVPPVIQVENALLLPGDIGLANESRFNAAFFSEPLTEFASGWKEPNDLQAILDFVAPPVQVGRRFEYKRADNNEAFLLDSDDARAIGADFKRIEYRGTSVNDKTLNRGLTIRIDLDAVGDMPDWRELYTTRLLQRLVRNELKRAVDLMVNSATNVAKTWDTSAGKDPDQDILTELMSANDSAGIRPNRLLFGDVAWNKRLIAHRAQATAGGFASATLSLDDLASYLNVEGIRISRERYQSSAAAKSKVTPDVLLMFFGQDAATTEDPTSAKRFWSPVEGGGKFRVFEQQVSAKMIDLTVEYYSNVLLTSAVGLRKLTIS